MGKRIGWEALSPAQRKRYVGAGVTKSSYDAGASLKKARGYHPIHAPKSIAPPKEAFAKVKAGKLLNTKELKSLERWQQKKAPKWLRDNSSIGADTAAQLVDLNLSPQNWSTFKYFLQPDGTYLVYVGSKRGGDERKTTLQNIDQVNEALDVIFAGELTGDGEESQRTQVTGIRYRTSTTGTPTPATPKQNGKAFT